VTYLEPPDCSQDLLLKAQLLLSWTRPQAMHDHHHHHQIHQPAVQQLLLLLLLLPQLLPLPPLCPQLGQAALHTVVAVPHWGAAAEGHLNLKGILMLSSAQRHMG
jgi:hypothetical protein